MTNAAAATGRPGIWVSGPPLVLVAGALWSSAAALVAAGVVLLLATAVFAGSSASRAWRPQPGARRPAGGAVATSGMRTLVLVLTGVGVVFGATEVAVAAATDGLGRTWAAGPLLGLWGVGSLVGGVAAARLGGGARTGRGLAVLLVVLGAGHAALAVADRLELLSGLILLAGTMIAPILATAYAMVEDAAPRGTVTEAFAWLATATAVGTAAGAATAGILAETIGPMAAFLLAGAAAGGSAALAGLRRRTQPSTADPTTSLTIASPTTGPALAAAV